MAICCSSGTTGLPKGVCISNKACSADLSFTNGSTIMFSFSEVDWVTGLYNLIYNMLSGGKRIITTKPFSPEYLLELIMKYKINFLMTCPSHMAQLSLLPEYNKESLQHVRLICMTGSPCSEATLQRIRSALTRGYLLNAYGTTEFGGISGALTGYKPRSAGKITYNVKLKIINQFTGEHLPPNELGEICVANNNTWLGYYNNPGATKQILDSEGFLHTGDLGYMDDEHYLYLVERCKDVLKFELYHYSPHEIEELIMGIPDVVDACVFGVFDELKNDIPAAAVVKRSESNLLEEDIVKYVESKTLSEYKRLHYGVFFVHEIPYNVNGKVVRPKVKEMCLARLQLQQQAKGNKVEEY